MRAWCFLAFALAEDVGADAGCSADEDEGLCLLSLRSQLRATAGGATAAACPGKTVQKTTVRDTCQCTGVRPEEVNEKQDDNFDIKTETYFVRHATGRTVIPQLEAHPFSEGTTTLLAEYQDFADLLDLCARDVDCTDDEAPKWKYSLVLNDPVFKLDAGEKCEVNVNYALTQYAILEGNSEEGGFAKAATDNCNVASSTLKVFSQREGKVVYDGDVNSVPVDLPVVGPGLFDFQFKVTDTAGLSIKHDTVLAVHDKTPPTGHTCPESQEATVNHTTELFYPLSNPAIFNPKVTEDNCGTAGLFPTGEQGEGACTPPLDQPIGMGVTAFTCHLTDRVVNNDYTLGVLAVNTIPCEFTYTVRQHVPDPVTITCPEGGVKAAVYEDAAFGVPDFTVATAAHAMRDDVVITYHAAADKSLELTKGMPFQFGVTTVIARASGAAGQTDDKYWEAHMVECAFTVTVEDPHPPLSDGDKFKCGAQNGIYEPYTLCDGTGLEYHRSPEFAQTLEYAPAALVHRVMGPSPCCDDAEGNAYVCAKTQATDTFAYCQPKQFTPASAAAAAAKPGGCTFFRYAKYAAQIDLGNCPADSEYTPAGDGNLCLDCGGGADDQYPSLKTTCAGAHDKHKLLAAPLKDLFARCRDEPHCAGLIYIKHNGGQGYLLNSAGVDNTKIDPPNDGEPASLENWNAAWDLPEEWTSYIKDPACAAR